MQKIDRNALVKSQVAGGCAKKSNSASANNTTTVVIKLVGQQ